MYNYSDKEVEAAIAQQNAIIEQHATIEEIENWKKEKREREAKAAAKAAAAKLQVKKNHINRIVRDLNELIENVFKFELGIKVLFSTVDGIEKPFIITIRFGGDNEGAEWGAEWIAETAHNKLMQYKDIYNQSQIDTYNYNEHEEE